MYAAASGMIVQMIRTDTIANNLANADTTAFKKDLSVFTSNGSREIYRIDGAPFPALPVEMKSATPIGTMTNGSNFVRNYIDFSQGSLQRTNNQLDVAITGPDYFTVRTPAGILYTRDGSFQLEANGMLVTQNGYPVLNPQGNPILLGAQSGDVTIDQEGNIFLNSQFVDQIARVSLPQSLQIQKVGDNLYGYNGPVSPAKGEARQGFLESSNANGILEMIHLIEAQRAYEASSKALMEQDNATQLAVTQVGKTQ